MTIEFLHPEYKTHIGQWTRCRDAIEGSDSVKNKGRLYLPALSDQSETEYQAYVLRALFYGATKRTVQGLLGAIFRKEPTIESPNEDLLETITIAGAPIQDFSKIVCQEIFATGRVGVLADVFGNAGNTPYLTNYRAENITNWKVDLVDGREVLSQVILMESYSIPGETEFESKQEIQYRVLEMNNGSYIQRLFRRPKDGGEFAEQAVVGDVTYPLTPLKNGQPLDSIPFYIINAYGLGVAIEEPPLLELVDVNFSHYRSSADLEHGAHFTALPTAWVAGFPADTKLKIGSAVAWVSEDYQANAGFLEYTGQGLGALTSLLEGKERKMAVLGARLLEDQKKQTEATDTWRMRMAGETGAVAGILTAIDDGIQKALATIMEWNSVAGNVVFNLNADLLDQELSPQMLVALMQTWQSGGMSKESFVYNLKRGELLHPDRTVEEEINLIDTSAPIMVGGNAAL